MKVMIENDEDCADVLMQLSDRIMVLCGGQVSGILDGPGADRNEVGLMMTSVKGGKDLHE